MSKVRVDEVADRAGTGPAKQLSSVPISSESVDASGPNGFILATIRFVKNLLGLSGTSVLSSLVKTFLAATTVRGMHEALMSKQAASTTSANPTFDLATANVFFIEQNNSIYATFANKDACVGRLITVQVKVASAPAATQTFSGPDINMFNGTLRTTGIPVVVVFYATFTVIYNPDTANHEMVQLTDWKAYN